MRELDLIFNFSQVFTEIKDIILKEILQYYDLDEQKISKKELMIPYLFFMMIIN